MQLTICRGDSFPEAIRRSLQLGGRSALFLRVLLSSTAERAASPLGQRMGIDMLGAAQAAKDIGAQLVLGEFSMQFL